MLKKIKQVLEKNKYKILAGVSFLAAGYLLYHSVYDDRNIKLSTFLEALKSDQLSEVVVKGNEVFFRSETSDWFRSVIGNFPIEQLFKEFKFHPDLTFACEEFDEGGKILLLKFAAIGLTLYSLERINNGHYKNTSKVEKSAKTNENFDSFYGGEHIKKYFMEVISHIKEPKKYEELGIRLRRGILLHGPPGTGKTMLARIIANEANLPFIRASASQFEEIFVGVGPKRIRDLFEEARKCKQGCVIFIDELDAIGSRSQGWQTKEQRSTINQMLTEIDGFQQNEKVIVIGATNNYELLDKALIRPGRFDLKIYVSPPNEKERAGLLGKLLENRRIKNNLNLEEKEKVAKMCENWCGADFESLINQCGYEVLRRNEREITFENMTETIERLHRQSK